MNCVAPILVRVLPSIVQIVIPFANLQYVAIVSDIFLMPGSVIDNPTRVEGATLVSWAWLTRRRRRSKLFTTPEDILVSHV